MARRGQTKINTQAKAKAGNQDLAAALAACEARGAAMVQPPIMRGRQAQVATESAADPLAVVPQYFDEVAGPAVIGAAQDAMTAGRAAYDEYAPQARGFIDRLPGLIERGGQAISTGAQEAGADLSRHFADLAAILSGERTLRERPPPATAIIRDRTAAPREDFATMAADARATIANALAGATDMDSKRALQDELAALIARAQAAPVVAPQAGAAAGEIAEADRVLERMRQRRQQRGR